MKLKKYILFTLFLLLLINITSVSAVENNTNEIGVTDENPIEVTDEKILSSFEDNNELSSMNNINQTNSEFLAQSQNDDVLSDFSPYSTQITLTINDTSEFETTGNITVNMHFSFITPDNGEFSTYNIHIYENDTLIKKINIGDLNLPDVTPKVTYAADVPFTYTIHPNSYLTTSLFGIYSNTLHFEEIKNNNLIKSLNDTQILIDNTYSSNRSWNNSVKSLQKAIDLATSNGIITLTDINFIQDTIETILVNKNITVDGKNASFILDKTQTLLEIQSNTQVTLSNLTFIGNNNYIISNKGNLKLINCTFKDNSLGLIDNIGELELENCIIEDINRFYQTRPSNTNGLITNTKTMKITNTTFTNNKYLPYNLPTETTSLKGIIYNKGNLYTENVKFTNINYRIIYNDGKSSINNTLFENITSTSTQAIYLLSTQQPLNNKYTYNNYKTQSTTKKINGGAIYNTKELTITNSSFNNIVGSDGGAIYNTKELTITNSTFNNIAGNDGGALYSKNNLKIINSTIKNTIGDDGGAIYNTQKLTIINSLFNTTQTRGTLQMNHGHDGGAIYNAGTCEINNSTITESKSLLHGGGIYNKGILIVNNTTISKCDGAAGTGIYNNKSMTLNNCQIINNYQNNAENLYVDHGGWGDIFCIGSGIIFNNEEAQATISKSIIKDNTIISGFGGGGGYEFFGIIRNKGEMNILSCVFDNNQGTKLFGYDASGGINIYNVGKITVMYSYLLNTKIYTGTPKPVMFLYNTGKGTCNINYNFYCLNPSSIIANANPNYYFTPAFEDEYYPIKLNEKTNITLTLGLTNGEDIVEFNDWDKLITPGLNATITTINENGEYINITILLKDKFTFNFNNTAIKGQYIIYASILNYNTSSIVDVGKEFANMTVTYNNITYNDGNNITFHVKIDNATGNVTFTYNNKKTTLNLTDGECSFTISETLKPNNYTMRIDYNGDENYFKILKKHFQFTVHKIPINVTITAKEIKVDQQGEIRITVTPDTSKLIGYLYISDGNKVRKFSADTQGSRTLKPKNFEEGIWNATVIFNEDEYYMGGSASTIFIVSRYTTNITLNTRDVKEGESNATVNITITPGDVRGEAIIEINGVNQTIFINSTVTPITITDLREGLYTVNIHYPGDAKYLPSNATTTFSVARITSKLNVEITYNENLTGIIHIQTNYRNCTGEVGIYINNDLTIINLTDGEINTPVKFKRGTNYIYIHYNGDSYYSISNWSATKFLDGKPQMTLETTTLLSNQEGYIRIILKDIGENPYEYTDITLEFNNQTMTLKTDENGTIYYPVKVIAGTYTAKATYNTTTVTKTLTVKVPVKITVQIPNINQDDDLMVYATLTSDEKINDNIILEINGQYYKIIITNGVGSRNLGEFKTGQYTFNAIYPGTQLLTYTNTTGTFNVATNNYKITGNTNIVQYYGATKYYKIRLTNNNQPVKGEIINIKINKNTVQVKTDSQGYATLKLGLKAGKYTITSTYKNIKVSNKITVKPTLITKNKKIKKGKTLTYTAKLLNKNGKKLKNKKITFKINGKKYKAKTNKKGIAKIKVKNLKKGKYKIKTTYGKQKNTNTITVK